MNTEITDADRESEFYREEWMSDDQWRCALVASELKFGFHHVKNLEKAGRGILFEEPSELATFDFDMMTRAVVLAHARAVRISTSAEMVAEKYEGETYERHRLIVMIHPRKHDGERMFERHPTLDDLVGNITKNFPCQTQLSQSKAEIDRLREDLRKNCDAMSGCEGCGAPLFPDDDFASDDCAGCWATMTGNHPDVKDTPCYAYRVGKPSAHEKVRS